MSAIASPLSLRFGSVAPRAPVLIPELAVQPGSAGAALAIVVLSTWVNSNLKDVKISQTLLRHSKPDITASVYIHSVPEENLKAQEQYVAALALQKPASDAVQ
jgi:hypothetical protein